MASQFRNITISIFLLSGFGTLAQESIGLHLSEYLPATAIQLNPAFSVDAKTRADIHLTGLSAFASNNHAFYAGEGPGIGSILQGEAGDGTAVEGPGERNGYADVSIDGPGFSMALGRSSIGISTRYRAMTDIRRADEPLAQFIFNGFRYSPLYDIDLREEDVKYSGLNWGELGVNLGQMLYVGQGYHINAGVTLKRLFGQRFIGFHIDEINYRFTSQDLFANGFNGSYTTGSDDLGLGNGWGLDAGLVYRKFSKPDPNYVPYSPENRCRKSQYQYQVGISLLDYGRMSFKQNRASTVHQNSTVFWEDYIQTSVNNPDSISLLLEQRLETDQNAFTREDKAVASLPSAVSIQFDYRFEKGLHLGAVLQQSLAGATLRDVRRANILGVVPRYVQERFELAMPWTLYEYEKLNMGLALRYSFFTLGSDDLGQILTDGDLYSADIYASIRVPVYARKSCATDRKGKRKHLVAPCWGQ